jgi:hypothetical protein
MLDFYFISDELPDDYALKQAEYAGGIKMREFEQAQHAHVIDYQLDFFDDFRWSSVQVKQKLALLHSTHSDQFATLMQILQRAEELNCGVIAFGD